MVRIDETAGRIVKLMEEHGLESFVFDPPIVLDSGDVDDKGEWDNYSVRKIYQSLDADTVNLGRINLPKDVPDEDDWYTIEDCLKDGIAK